MRFIATIVGLAAAAPPPGCRCVPPDPCWDAVPWATLNGSVGGRLVVTLNELAGCIANISSDECSQELTSTDDEFWLSAQPGGYLHTGQFGIWNISALLPAYSVVAETEGDFQATVAFAQQYNLRLVVKATGHDWYGRSAAAGSLMLWTHARNNIVFNDSWVPQISDGRTVAPIPAVTLQTGVQFKTLYTVAEAAGKFVMGGTCDSVGVGGCWMGGCYGTLSRLYGAAAANILEARVVLANGSLVVANAGSNPDLFWAIRGGGAGVAGVVTEFTARTHAPPRWLVIGSVSVNAANPDVLPAALEQVLIYSNNVLSSPAWSGNMGFYKFGVSMSSKGFEASPETFNATLQPLLDWLDKQVPGQYTVSHSYSIWNASSPNPGPLPWYESHPDREISTALAASLSRYPNIASLGTPEGVAALAALLANVTSQLPDIPGFPFGIDFEKGQAGASEFAQELLKETSVNPVLLQATGLFLVMVNVPYLPQLPPSSRLLNSQWPRLQQYLFSDHNTPLFQTCASGAAGNESDAVDCYTTIQEVTIPAIRNQIAIINATMNAGFPNVGPDGLVYSGSYYNECDYTDPKWQESFWGPASNGVYARLRRIKDAYDPQGLFTCHHCVGSEDWSEDGNCRVNRD